MMGKRILLFLAVNALIVVTILLVTNILGIRHYVTEQGIDYSALLVFSAIVGFTGALISLALSRAMAKWMLGVRVLSPDDPNLSPDGRWLGEEVRRLARRAGLTEMPEVGIYDSPEVNAFATGPTRNRSLVAVSTGLLENMDKDGVQGVLGHEVAHIANGDMVTMTLLQGVINTFVIFLSRLAAYVVSRFVREELAGVVHFICIIVFDLLFSILGSIVVMAYSRHREYHADRGGADLAGKEKMIHALRLLQQHVNLIDTNHKSLQTMKISNRSGWLKLFSSHPDLEDRIARLERA